MYSLQLCTSFVLTCTYTLFIDLLINTKVIEYYVLYVYTQFANINVTIITQMYVQVHIYTHTHVHVHVLAHGMQVHVQYHVNPTRVNIYCTCMFASIILNTLHTKASPIFPISHTEYRYLLNIRTVATGYPGVV